MSSEFHHTNGTITPISNATYTITPNPYTSNDSLILSERIIPQLENPLLEILNDSHTNPDSRYYSGEIAADDVLPGKYRITLSGYDSTQRPLVDNMSILLGESGVSSAAFSSYHTITEKMSITPSLIDSESLSKINQHRIMVGNSTVSADTLPAISVIPDGMISDVSSDVILVSSNLSEIANGTIPAGHTIMDSLSLPTYTMPQGENLTSIIPPVSILGNNSSIISTPPNRFMGCRTAGGNSN